MSLIRTVNVADITKKLLIQVGQWPQIADKKAVVERSEPPNQNSNRTPWIGLYRSGVTTVPRTIGVRSGYRQQRVSLIILVQDGSFVSGEDCEEKLEYMVQQVTSALLSDESLGGTVDVLEDLQVVYEDYRQDGAAFLQTATIQFTGIFNVVVE